VQPIVAQWNPSGYLWNAIDQVRVEVAAGAPSQTTAPAPSATSDQPASAPEPEVVAKSCLTCHERDLIAQQRLTRAGWGREVDKMIRWGAPVTDAEKKVLIEFLAGRYPAR
jgi:hypothetical protein